MSLDTIHLETSGKGEKIEKQEALIQLANISDVKKYLEKLSGKSKDSRLKNPEIQKQVTLFLETAANNGLSKNLNKFNAKKFDTDGESGLDKFEFEQFSKSIQGAIEQIIALDGTNAFDRIHSETQEKGGWTNPDIWLADKSGQITQAIFGENGSAGLTERAIKSVGNFSEEELHRMAERPFSISLQSGSDLSILLAKEIGSGVEDAIKFITNIPAGLILLPRYLSYRIDSNSDDLQKKTEGEIKLAEMVGNNSSLSLVELLGEKGIQMIQELGKMMKSGKQGDIVKLLVTIAGLLTGGALAAKGLAKMSRRTGVEMARRGIGRTVEGRALRNGLRDTAKAAGKVAEVAGKVDNVISGNAALGQVTKKAASGITKVAPAMGMAANDAGNISELDRARAKKQSQQSTDAVESMEMKATGTDGPVHTIRASSDNNLAGRSTESLQTELQNSRSLKDPDARLTAYEGRLAGEISRRANPEGIGTRSAELQKPSRTPDVPRVIDFAEKQARELGKFRDTILLGGDKAPLVYIERNGTIEIGRFHSMNTNGNAMIEVITQEGKIGLKPVSLEDLAKFNDPEKRINQRITPEIRANKMKMEQAYAKSGVNPLEIQLNAMLGDTERIAKAEKILGRTLSEWENLAVFHIHENISKGIYNNSTGNLMNMAKTWEKMTGNTMKDPARFDEFRKLVENGILGQNTEFIALKEASKKITRDIDIYGVDHILDKIKDRKLNQSQLNAVVLEYLDSHGPKITQLDEFFRETLDIAGYIGDKEGMFQQAFAYAKEMKFEKVLAEINTKPLKQTLEYIATHIDSTDKIVAEILKNNNPKIKKELLTELESNQKLYSKILHSENIGKLIKVMEENLEQSTILLRDTIQNESILMSIAPEHLSTINRVLEKMIKENIFSGGLIETLRTKLDLIRDAKSPIKQIKYFLKNGDETIGAKLKEPFSGLKATWNMLFDDLRITETGPTDRLRMIELGEKEFFWKSSLDTFFHFTFPNFPEKLQKEFIKKHITPEDGKYHSLLDEFPAFKENLKDKGFI